MIRRFAIRSLGCKVSQYDGERLAAILVDLGFTPAGEDAPDLFFLNSCSVTGRASQKARQALRASRKRWPAARIILAGCETALLERSGQAPAEVDGMLPLNPTREMVVRLLDAVGFPAEDGVAPDAEPGRPEGSRTRAYLKIQDGCDQFCSYCIVPHLRGRERSRSLVEVVEEGRRLAGMGYREIVLTGIHLGRFAPGLVPLVTELERVPGLARLRLSSIEPLEVTSDLLDWLATSPAACAHLHLPLQAGTDAILQAMNRPYSTSQFEAVVARVRERLPDIGLTTDLIVGFPGEDEPSFTAGLAFVERMRFSRIHIFRYSARPGTPAATMEGQVPNPVKQDRSRAVEAVWKRSAAAFHARFLGREVEVLWETQEDGVWKGMNREYVPCRLTEPSPVLANTLGQHRVLAADSEGVTVGPD